MAGERQIIPVPTTQALQFVDAIEGLIFDPQPYKTFVVTPVKRHRSFLGLFWLKPRQQPVPTPDLIGVLLKNRYRNIISEAFYQLTRGDTIRDLEGDAQEPVYGSHLYTVNKRPSLLVDAGNRRQYQIDLQLVRDTRFLFLLSFLHLQWVEDPQAEANMMLSGRDVMRITRDGKYGEFYIPAFIEQQRLLAVNELLRKYMGPTWPPN